MAKELSPLFPEKVKVLMVDDEPKNLLALEAVLESLDQTLVRANSGQEALACLLHDDFAVILLDVQMPEMDGFEFATLIRTREKNRSVPIIFLTAVGKTEAEMFRGYEAGAMDYLLKPFSPVILRYKVRVLVELYQKGAEISRLNTELVTVNAGLARKVEERTDELLRSNTELAQFAAVAAHDLQEPLRTLGTYLQMIEENNAGSFKAQDADFFKIALDAARRMRSLINDLLAFSQVGNGDRKLEAVDLGALVQETLAKLRQRVEESGVQIEVGPLPVLPGEPLLLGQVFQNLIENALKFQPGEAPRLKISAERRGGIWVMAIQDFGIGVSPEYFEKIFKLFQRLHSRDAYPGTGIGLAICRKVVERHGGKIWLESTPGEGSTFFFSIPAGS